MRRNAATDKLIVELDEIKSAARKVDEYNEMLAGMLDGVLEEKEAWMATKSSLADLHHASPGSIDIFTCPTCLTAWPCQTYELLYPDRVTA